MSHKVSSGTDSSYIVTYLWPLIKYIVLGLSAAMKTYSIHFPLLWGTYGLHCDAVMLNTKQNALKDSQMSWVKV